MRATRNTRYTASGVSAAGKRMNGKRKGTVRIAAVISAVLIALAFLLFSGGNGGDAPQQTSGTDVVYETIDPLVDASGEEREETTAGQKLILAQELPVIYGVEIEEVYTEQTPEASGQAAPSADIYFDVLPEQIKLDILRFSSEDAAPFYVGASGPQILIYHTHTLEAYRQIPSKEYVEAGAWRTEDFANSVVAVGEALAGELREYGFGVLHDTTNHEPPKLSTSYTRSLETMQQYANDYTTLSLYIDVHRDAYGDIESGSKDIVTINGEECARVMFVVGTGEGKTSSGFGEKPNYESNYKLAHALTGELESMAKGFTRPIRVKSGRYNQHVSDMCLLIEVGHNANALVQAKNTAKYVALALSRIISPAAS